eukprot:1628166-Lingulodinium_polyedra.AAC.1
MLSAGRASHDTVEQGEVGSGGVMSGTWSPPRVPADCTPGSLRAVPGTEQRGLGAEGPGVVAFFAM